ncbi:hypothetical protein [Halomicrobium katesii]|uniref:hypothetical protein n=1 Tax=Halomicrobium katesii TaxID=437163 RepID=UPI00036BF8E6|nr:hypothetical protein [Halomicrobium katesii]
MSSDDNNQNKSRREVLRGMAVAGATAIGASTAGAASDASLNDITERGTPSLAASEVTRSVSIRASGEASYTFSVTGLVSATDAPSESLDAGTATATIEGETHAYDFSGEFTELDVSGGAEVVVDGDSVDPDAFPQQTLTVIAPGHVDVDISASGRVEADDELEKPNARTVRGTINGRTDISYAGELTYFDASDRVWVRRDGQKLAPDDALPASLPGEMEISGDGRGVTVEVSGDADSDHAHASVEDGSVSAYSTQRGTTARYDGRVERIEHESGATVEIVPESKRVVCTAPENRSVEFSTESTEAFIYEEEVHKNPTVTVAAGETERIQYFGDVTSVGIARMTVSFDYMAYESAQSSARLQMAAKFERLDAYDQLASAVEGRIRHDADGLYTITSDTATDPVDSVTFKLTDLETGDEGAVSVTKRHDTDDVVAGKNTYQWRNDAGNIEQFRHDTLEVGSLSTAAAGLSTETYEFDAPETTQPETQGDWIPTIPWGDWIGDIYDGLKDVADGIQDVSADYLAEAIEYADVSSSEIAVTGGKIVANTINSFQSLATKFIDDFKIKALWKLRITGYSSMISLVGSGVFEAIGDENYDCGACVAFIRLSLDVGLCGYGVAAFCGAFSLTTLGLGTVPCAVLGGAICSLTISALPDAKDICSSDTYPTQAGFC